MKYVLDANVVTRLLLVTHDAALQDGAIGGLVVEDWLDSAP